MSELNLHFVISAPRSGSTWLMNALNQHPEIFATEQRLFGNFCEMWPNNNGNLAPRITFDSYARALSVHYQYGEYVKSRTEFCDDFVCEYLAFLVDYAQRKTNCSVIIDKITPYPGTAAHVVEQIHKFVPNAKIYKLVRDGRDVLTSGTFDWLLKDGTDTDRYKFYVKGNNDVRLKRFFDDQVIEKWAKIWKESIAAMRRISLTDVVRYEEMNQALPTVLQRILETLDIESDREISQQMATAVSFERMAGRTQGTMSATAKERKGIVGDWVNYLTYQDAVLFDRIAGKQLIDEGYQLDSTWVDSCPAEFEFRRLSGNE